MLTAAPLLARPEFEVHTVACKAHHRHWSAPECRDDYRIVLVRRGRYRRDANGITTDLDPTVGYLGVPGEQERFAHPAGGDDCTAIFIQPRLWHTVAGERAGAIYVDARVDLAHRALLRTRDAHYAATQHLVELIATTTGRTVHSGRSDRTLADQARSALIEGDPGDLISLAAQLGVSPYRLSRAFSATLGVSITKYRNRIRVGRALAAIEHGTDSLAVLAADLGFADQAHLCRTIKAHTGQTPTGVRRLLS